MEKPGEPKAEAVEPALDVEGASKEEVKEENAVEVFEGKEEAQAAQAPQAQEDVLEAEVVAKAFSEPLGREVETLESVEEPRSFARQHAQPRRQKISFQKEEEEYFVVIELRQLY